MYTCIYLLGFCPNEQHTSLILSNMVSDARRP